jgi:hypothetical protein
MKYLPLADIPDGALILVERSGATKLGIKGSHQDRNVIVLFPEAQTLIDQRGQWSAVSLGTDWRLDFEPMAVTVSPSERATPGDILITESGLCIVAHDDSGQHAITPKGEIVSTSRSGIPQVKRWSILMTQLEKDREIYQHGTD